MEVGNDVRAETRLHRHGAGSGERRLATGESWRSGSELRQAKQRLDRSHALLPATGKSTPIWRSGKRTRESAAAMPISAKPFTSMYQCARPVSAGAGSGAPGRPDSEAQFQQLIEQILRLIQISACALELSRIAAKRGDAATCIRLSAASRRSLLMPPAARQQLSALKCGSGRSGDPRCRASSPQRADADPSFRQSLAVIRAQPGEEAQPFQNFLRLPSPSSLPAPADGAMRFVPESLPNPQRQKWDWIGAVWLNDRLQPTVITANAATVSVMGGPSFPFPGGPGRVAPGPESIVP